VGKDADFQPIVIGEGDQLVLLMSDPWTSGQTVTVFASFYNPTTGETQNKPVGGLQSVPATTVSSFSTKLPQKWILQAVAVGSSNLASPLGAHVQVFLFRNGAIAWCVCSGWLYDRNIPSWPRGSQEHGRADIERFGAIFSLFQTITNNAMNSGNHVVNISPGSGNRFVAETGRILNGDAAARSTTVAITDGTNDLAFATVGALGAGSNIQLPYLGGAPAAGGNNPHPGPGGVQLAGDMQLRMAVASVAVNEDTAQALSARCFAGVPTVSTSAPCGAVLVTTVAVEVG
jgi:hypothetical protein